MPTDEPADAERYAQISRQLLATVDEVVGPWIEQLVRDRLTAWRGDVDDELAEAATRAGEAARTDAVDRLRTLVETDIDHQGGNPLSVLRSVTRHAHDVLAATGVPELRRDQFAEGSFPEDVYDLVPANWAEIDERLHEPGMMWGAAKAYLFTSRRKREGRT